MIIDPNTQTTSCPKPTLVQHPEHPKQSEHDCDQHQHRARTTADDLRHISEDSHRGLHPSQRVREPSLNFSQGVPATERLAVDVTLNDHPGEEALPATRPGQDEGVTAAAPMLAVEVGNGCATGGTARIFIETNHAMVRLCPDLKEATGTHSHIELEATVRDQVNGVLADGQRSLRCPLR